MAEEHPIEKTPRRGFASRLVVVVALVIAIAAVIYLKRDRTDPTAESIPLVAEHQDISVPAEAKAETTITDPARKDALPRMVDLGAHKCIPCKMMAPILEELRQEYAGRFEVVFIDVWQNKSEAQRYGIRLIPTQIFYDAAGKELFRHQGFFSKEDILNTWQKYGYDFGPIKAAEGSS